jgi:hypothetical protein
MIAFKTGTFKFYFKDNVLKVDVNVLMDLKELIANSKAVQDVVLIKDFVKKANVFANKDIVEIIVK